IFDVKYTDLIADPLATARRVYAHFGLDMTEETVAGLSSYQKRNPKGKHGAHDYSLEDVGLSADIITERYKSYSAAFL
ncbi:MAG TPA: sulfotransferase, partial [Rhodobacteraceae bacterium]|nr:sulfotransferase [Paracoccaceae bacterium]